MISLLAAMYAPEFKDCIPHASALRVRSTELTTKAVADEGVLDTNLGIAGLVVAVEKFRSGSATEQVDFLAINLKGEPVWGAEWRSWSTAIQCAAENESAPTMEAVSGAAGVSV
jgi:hypothetical protein